MRVYLDKPIQACFPFVPKMHPLPALAFPQCFGGLQPRQPHGLEISEQLTRYHKSWVAPVAPKGHNRIALGVALGYPVGAFQAK